MCEPSVSVVIPTRDRWPFLERALSSVFAQTVPVHQVVVVDDGSTDGTVDRLAERRDPRMKVVPLTRSGGAPHARNVGMAASRGRIIAFLDSDDEWLPTYLETTLALFDQEPRPVAVCAALIRRSTTEDTTVCPDWPEDGFERILSQRSPVCPAILVDRDAVNGVRWDESLPALQERDLLLSLSRLGRVACCPDALYIQHQDAADRISVPRNQVLAREMLIRKYERDLEERPAALANNYFRLARVQHTLGDRSGVRDSLRRASAADPSDRRYRVLARFSATGSRTASLGLDAYTWLSRVKGLFGDHARQEIAR
jgi:glycosyltransferase involved in cell wall biosynthesis